MCEERNDKYEANGEEGREKGDSTEKAKSTRKTVNDHVKKTSHASPERNQNY